MQKFLEELYRDFFLPGEGTFPHDPAYREAGKEVCRLEEILLAELPGKKRELYEAFQRACDERNDYEEAQLFVDAFKLGARLMLEVAYEG